MATAMLRRYEVSTNIAWDVVAATARARKCKALPNVARCFIVTEWHEKILERIEKDVSIVISERGCLRAWKVKMLEKVVNIINTLSHDNPHLLIAIDGRCASGKTTLAMDLKQIYKCNVIHMDDFFLRPEQRTTERLCRAGENVDHERFLEEVLVPLRNGENFSYRPFDCKTNMFSEPIAVGRHGINIIEGSYSCHPDLWDFYDLRIFLTVSPEVQRERIISRNGVGKAEIFRNKWIPLEERYFKEMDIANRCDLYGGY